jgi:membrane protein DedA with SNARE-associated domain
VTEVAHQLAALVAHYGIPALFLSLALEALGLPLPGESAIIVASGAAASGEFHIRTVFLTAFAAAVLGDGAAYLIGRKLGRPVIARVGGRFGLTEAVLARIEGFFAKYGPVLVVVARFIVPLRQFNGLVAGTSGMNWMAFMAANVVGAALWVGLWVTLAYRFGLNADVIPWVWHHLSLVAAVAVPLVIAALIYLRLRHRRAR